jgi:hypothetical protein
MNKPILLGRIFCVSMSLTAAGTLCSSALDIIPFGSTWSYMHPTDGVNPNIADTDFDSTWFADITGFAAYNGSDFGSVPALVGPPFDSGTSAAPFGYGTVTALTFATPLTEPANDTKFTAYFRHEFEVTDPVERMAIDIFADDGAVIYLDGVLLREVNYTGADVYDGLSIAGGDENNAVIIRTNLGGLTVGDHVLAVSMHQTSATSSDLGFDLRLSDEGTEFEQIAVTDFDGAVTSVSLTVSFNDWTIRAPGSLRLNNGDGGTLTSAEVDLTGKTGVAFSLDFTARETSAGSNLEPTDTFTASLILTDNANQITIVNLLPPSIDPNDDGILTGDEVRPGADVTAQVRIDRTLIAMIPDGTIKAQLVISAINDSNTEFFEISNGRFFNPINIGIVNFGSPENAIFAVGPNNWVESQPYEFTLNNADGGVLASQQIDTADIGTVTVSLDFHAEETSTGSNFEIGDTFQSWVIATDATGATSRIEMIMDDGDNILDGTEIAPGAPVADSVMFDLALSVSVPASAELIQLFIDADNNSPTETFRFSNVQITGSPEVAADFAIISITPAASGFDITFESESGVTYELEFSPDLTTGSFNMVGSQVAAALQTTFNHDPGATTPGFYRVRKLITAQAQ